MSNRFPEYNQLSLSDVNKMMLKEWDEKNIFGKSLEMRQGHPRFVFYEGPLPQMACRGSIMLLPVPSRISSVVTRP